MLYDQGIVLLCVARHQTSHIASRKISPCTAEGRGVEKLKNINILSKLLVLLGVFVLSLGAVALSSLDSFRVSVLDSRKQEMKTVTDAVVSTAQYYQARADKRKETQEDAIAHFYEEIASMRFADGAGYFFSFDDGGTVQMHGASAGLVGRSLWDSKDVKGNYITRPLLAEAKKGGGYASYFWPKPGQPDDQAFEKIAYGAPLPWGHYIGTGLYIDDVEAIFWAEVTNVILFSSIAILITLGVGVMVSRDIATPLRRLELTIGSLSKRDSSDPLPEIERRDEIGRIARNILNLRTRLQQDADADEKKRQDDRAKRAQEQAAKTNALADQLEQQVKSMITRMSDSVRALGKTSTDMESIAQQTSTRSNEVRTTTAQASNNIGSVASATEELTASAREIGHQIQSSSQVTNTVSEEVVHANSRVEALAQAVERIGDVIRLIEDITEQTNLLALNATIEAARAGDAGKGFAVVANEVRSLASQTAKATAEITTQIKDIQSESQKALDSVSGISTSITQVAEQADAIVSTVEEQNSAIREVAERVAQVSASTHTVSHHIDDVAGNAEQTLQSTQDIARAAYELANEARELEQKVDQFLNDIRKHA